jgi:hypothetical protein
MPEPTPHWPKTEHVRVMPLGLPLEMDERITCEAVRLGISRPEVIRVALAAYFMDPARRGVRLPPRPVAPAPPAHRVVSSWWSRLWKR